MIRFTVIICVAAVLLTWQGIALSVLWHWFATPLGVPPISTAHAIGIVCLLASTRSHSNSGESEKDAWTQVVGVFLAPLILLVIGRIALSFM